MPKTYRAGIIGAGRIASLLEKDPLRPSGCTHAGAYARQSNIEIAGVADIEQSKLQAFCEDWKLPQQNAFLDYREMLRCTRPELVSVAAFAPQRREMAIAAIESGAKGLWLEKAVGCSLQDAIAIKEALRTHQATAVVDYPRRGRALYRGIKKHIDAQTFGRLQSVTCHMTHQLIHTGSHAYDILRYWCGEALSVSGKLEDPAATKTETISDQGGNATLEMENGSIAFVSAYRKKYYIFQFDLVFDNARFIIGNDIRKAFFPQESQLYSGFKELFEDPNYKQWGSPYPRDMVNELVHSLETGKTPLFSLENAIEALRVALAIFYSARTGKPVSPSDVPLHWHVENA